MKNKTVLIGLCIICTLLFGAVGQATTSREYGATNWGAVSRGEVEAPEAPTETDETESAMTRTAKDRVKDEEHYWKVEVNALDCNADISTDEEGALIVNIDLTWDAKNGVPRTKTMLRLFGDDLAQTIFNKFKDCNITQLWCRWAVPYLYDKEGFIAKYKYEMIDNDVYMTDSNGLLFNMPDDYK